MLAGFVLSLREGLEGALIIGIVLAALKKTGRTDYFKYVWRGVAVAILFSLAAAWFLGWLGLRFEGRAEEIFEGSAMLLAAVLLTWMIFWMQRQAGSLKASLEDGVEQAARRETPGALTWLALLAVGREGLELVLFLSAAGLVAHGVHEFNEAGIIPSIIEHIWDTNFFINEKQPLGQVLTSLFGYNANPSLTEVFAYGLYFLVLARFWKAMKQGIERGRSPGEGRPVFFG